MTRPFALLLGLLSVAIASGQSIEDAKSFPLRDRALVDKGAKYLISAQDKVGGWETDWGPGITAICTRALAQAPSVGPRHAAVQRGAEFVLRHQRENGGICSAEGWYRNYDTSVALSM